MEGTGRATFVSLLYTRFLLERGNRKAKTCHLCGAKHGWKLMRLLFIGDIVGRPARKAVAGLLPGLKSGRGIDVVVANGENAAAGAGITKVIAEELHRYGVDIITLGDHCWDQRGFEQEIEQIPFICRPWNLPEVCPGQRFVTMEVAGKKLTVLTLLGQTFMKIKADNTFSAASNLLAHFKGKTDYLFVEIHAEATSEKVALGWLLDGQVSAVIGTHTHIPTADGRILPRGTAYLTDAGMTGPYTSVLGREIAPVVAAQMDTLPRKFPVATEDVRLCGCLLDLDEKKRPMPRV